MIGQTRKDAGMCRKSKNMFGKDVWSRFGAFWLLVGGMQTLFGRQERDGKSSEHGCDTIGSKH